ncbi:hypothetical protein ACKF11_13600 [Methylobacillus sp. Pita2]|uniref:hypothetical protein n=1 Tax=Methylobacillus sp. Pita2 TaxID=3383245 RepID=UPI0038B4E99F
MTYTVENGLRIATRAAGGDLTLSTGEFLLAAIVLDRGDWLKEWGYTMSQALGRLDKEWIPLLQNIESAFSATSQIIKDSQAAATSATALLALEPNIHYDAAYVTHADSPGYRDIEITLDVTVSESKPPHRLALRLDAQQGQKVLDAIQGVHRFAWNRAGGPLDAYPGELSPSWSQVWERR